MKNASDMFDISYIVSIDSLRVKETFKFLHVATRIDGSGVHLIKGNSKDSQ